MEHTLQADKDMQCPLCRRACDSGTVIGEAQKDGYLTLREVICHCSICGRSFDLVQFRQHGRWHSHKYRVAEEGFSFTCQWNLCCDLPAPPVIQTGPGGTYARPISAEDLDRKCKCIIQQCLDLIGKVVSLKNPNHEHPID